MISTLSVEIESRMSLGIEVYICMYVTILYVTLYIYMNHMCNKLTFLTLVVEVTPIPIFCNNGINVLGVSAKEE